jgi:hypothetical protein
MKKLIGLNYRAYFIRSNRRGEIWIEKNGQVIQRDIKDVDEAKKIIDARIMLDRAIGG